MVTMVTIITCISPEPDPIEDLLPMIEVETVGPVQSAPPPTEPSVKTTPQRLPRRDQSEERRRGRRDKSVERKRKLKLKVCKLSSHDVL